MAAISDSTVGLSPPKTQEKWAEAFRGGSVEAEAREFARLAEEILKLQRTAQRRTGSARPDRAFHAKQVLGVRGARFIVRPDLRADLAVGHFRPGTEYAADVRFSNASGTVESDSRDDLRGIAIRIDLGEGKSQDLLLTNAPASYARNARQFVRFAVAMSNPGAGRLFGLVKLAFQEGPFEALRMLRTVQEGRKRPVQSLALETFWSRGAIAWGESAVRYLLRPLKPAAAPVAPAGAERLRQDLAGRLGKGPIEFELCVQLFKSEATTPIEDGAARWEEKVSPPIAVATLVLPEVDVETPSFRSAEAEIAEMRFGPWYTVESFRPLGNLNRGRREAYSMSAAHRLGLSYTEPPPLRNRVVGALADRTFGGINRIVPWHRLPLKISLLNLDVLRGALRRKNLVDAAPTGGVTVSPAPAPPTQEERLARSFDGASNDLAQPAMGKIGTAFGRNMAADYRPDLFETPDPVLVSRELLTRKTFVPARSLNLLAAAWIQFQVHDWVRHDRHALGENDVKVRLPAGERWKNRESGPDEEVMRFGDDIPMASHGRRPGSPPIFANTVSHWWDGSEVYGIDRAKAELLRETMIVGTETKLRANLRLDEHDLLPQDSGGQDITGFSENWWLGLSIMHTLFAREHNAVCDALRREYKTLSEERIYQVARLVVSALIAKIHTVEWTPSILGTEAIRIALTANWNGPPSDWLTKLGLWLIDVHALTGIPKTKPFHHGAPYSLTEEFVTVYRMHPLIPDDYHFVDAANGASLGTRGLRAISARLTDDEMRRIGFSNAVYSFARSHPGAITLHNFPHALQAFHRENGEIVDLAILDLVRTRRRGVARYKAFREGLRMPPVRNWSDITANRDDAALLKSIYGSVDKVDTVVGLFAENPPRGFGFSDTAFRVFILMASRRIQSDRFLTTDFRPEIYTPLGIDWVAKGGMTSVILRHCPDLAALAPRESAFAPWAIN